MRADRLLSLLMLLQARGRMTAPALAAELDVSERTIYRDIDALCASGIPVYAETGRSGGFALVESYRTTLTGLTQAEVRALFMLSIPAPLAELGVVPDLRAALRKLSASLPVSRRQDERWVQQRFYLDGTAWRHGHESVPHLQIVQQAVWENRRLRVKYHPLPALEMDRIVDPLGLVAKTGIWYLVAASQGQIHVHRISELISVDPCAGAFVRPSEFDLPGFWKQWTEEHERSMVSYRVRVRIAPEFVSALPRMMGSGIREQLERTGPPDPDGWVRLELAFDSLFAARDRLLGLGRGVEVLEPWPLRQSLVDHARQIVALYAESDAGMGTDC